MLNLSLQPLLKSIRNLSGRGDCAEVSDAELLQTYLQEGNCAAFELILRRHERLIWGTCRRLLSNYQDAQDVFQATCLILAKKAATIRSTTDLGPWLYRVCYRAAVRARKQCSRYSSQHASLSDAKEVPDPQVDVASPALQKEAQIALDEEIQKLSRKYQLPLILCDLEGKTYEEAAQSLSWPKGTVSTRLRKAREILKARLLARGITLSLAAIVLSGEAIAAAPPACLSQTVQGCAGSESVFSPQVLQLTQGALQSMLIARIKVLLMALITCGLLGTGVGAWAFYDAEKAKESKPAPGTKEKEKKGQKKEKIKGEKKDAKRERLTLEEAQKREGEWVRQRIDLRTALAGAEEELQEMEEEHRIHTEIFTMKWKLWEEHQLSLQLKAIDIDPDLKDAKIQARMIEEKSEKLEKQIRQLHDEHHEHQARYHHKHRRLKQKVIELEERLRLTERLQELERAHHSPKSR